MNNKKEVRYVAIGDSYTICEGIPRERSWPVLLTKHLSENGIPIKLVANPSTTGWTTKDAIENELPIFQKAQPTFTTLLIGVNDWVQGVSEAKFRENLIYIIDYIQQILPNKNSLLLITIPDFSSSPNGQKYAKGRNISQGISEFNEIIKQEAKKINLPFVDIYPISQEMKNDSKLVAQDGLHPSAKEYELWERLIFPEAYKILR